MATIQVQQQSQPIQEVRTTLSTEVGGGGEFVETRSVSCYIDLNHVLMVRKMISK